MNRPQLAALVLAVLAIPGVAAAKKLRIDMEGFSGEATPIDATHVALHPIADGKATHMGNIHFESNEVFDYATSTVVSSFTITAADGDLVFGAINGTLTPDYESLTGQFEGVYEITGGTGRFAGATGEGSWDVFFPSLIPEVAAVTPAKVTGKGTIEY